MYRNVHSRSIQTLVEVFVDQSVTEVSDVEHTVTSVSLWRLQYPLIQCVRPWNLSHGLHNWSEILQQTFAENPIPIAAYKRSYWVGRSPANNEAWTRRSWPGAFRQADFATISTTPVSTQISCDDWPLSHREIDGGGVSESFQVGRNHPFVAHTAVMGRKFRQRPDTRNRGHENILSRIVTAGHRLELPIDTRRRGIADRHVRWTARQQEWSIAVSRTLVLVKRSDGSEHSLDMMAWSFCCRLFLRDESPRNSILKRDRCSTRLLTTSFASPWWFVQIHG